jgi:hypothetical protein
LEQGQYFDGSSRTIFCLNHVCSKFNPQSLLVPQILVNSLGFLGETVSLLGEILVFSQTPSGITGFRQRGFETTGLDGQRGGGHDGGSNVGFSAIISRAVKDL